MWPASIGQAEPSLPSCAPKTKTPRSKKTRHMASIGIPSRTSRFRIKAFGPIQSHDSTVK